MAVRGDRRIDEQYRLRSAHDGLWGAGTSRNKVNLSLTKRRSANTSILNPWLWNSLRKTRPSPKVDNSTSAAPPGFKWARSPAAKRSATSLDRQAPSRISLGAPRTNGGLKRI